MIKTLTLVAMMTASIAVGEENKITGLTFRGDVNLRLGVATNVTFTDTNTYFCLSSTDTPGAVVRHHSALNETKELVTNSWKRAVSLHEDGVTHVDSYILTGGSSIKLADHVYTASSIVGDNAVVDFGDDDYLFTVKCDREHVDDYPKVVETTKAVQYRVSYTLVMEVRGEKFKNVYEWYTYPHLKIVMTTTEKLVRKTETDTKEIKVRKP